MITATPQTTAAAPSEQFQPPQPYGFPGYQIGNNWRIQFADADGTPLSMVTFEIIDFGAISYKEIFQNVKTILGTPLFSAALERTLGVDQSIVDLPIGRAAEATIAIIDALFFWEPRAEVVSINFEADAINGHLACNLQLRVRNVMFGTNTAYTQSNLFPSPTKVLQGLPPLQQPVLIPGPAGPTGQRGSIWFAGASDPTGESILLGSALPGDFYLNTTSGDVFEFVAVAPVDSLGRKKWQRSKRTRRAN